MVRRRSLVVMAVLAVALAIPAAAGGKKIVTHSPDSLAPPEAPAHWLPPEPWVYNHWLPFDETRLYRVVGITRSELWQQLRDDNHSLAQLAARHGWRSPSKLAAVLVAPSRAGLGAARTRVLERRARRLITQGHLAQHAFFHSLHSFAIPSAAPDLFGVTDAAFRALRKRELSPLAIGRLHGRSPGEIEAGAIAVLRERVHAGVTGGAMPASQGRRLLRRQLSQLPRWLDQARYNGPPPTHRGALNQLPRDYASNPAISADGRHVAYEAYRQKLKLAITLGEIAVLRADLDTGASTLVSGIEPPGPNGADPRSDYNAAISGDGSFVTFESSAGNQTFAKRYGRIGVLLCDLSHAGSSASVAPYDTAVPDSQSAYNPAVAADGSRVAYTAVRGGRTSLLVRDRAGGAERTVVAGERAGGTRFSDPYEPGISGDGSRVVYTRAFGPVADPSRARSRVEVRDLRTGRTLIASREDGPSGAVVAGFSADPSLSSDGRFVAFTVIRPGGGTPRLLLRDLDTGRTTAIPTGGARPLDPAVANGGRVVAWNAVRGASAQIVAWNGARRTILSRAGRVANGWSEDPSISADGTRVAFASTATNLDPRKRDDTRGIFVRDLLAGTTRLISDPSVAYPKTGG